MVYRLLNINLDSAITNSRRVSGLNHQHQLAFNDRTNFRVLFCLKRSA